MIIYELRWINDKQIEDDSGQTVHEYFRTLREARARLKDLQADSYHAPGLYSDGFKLHIKPLSKIDLALHTLNRYGVVAAWDAVPSLHIDNKFPAYDPDEDIEEGTEDDE